MTDPDPFAPRCTWRDDRCEHGGWIDAADTNWNPETRKFTCAISERRTA